MPSACAHVRMPPTLHAGEESWQAYSVGESGLDRVEFLLAAGPAEPLRPLRAVASGGESARIMLALKAAPRIAQAQGVRRAAGLSDGMRVARAL